MSMHDEVWVPACGFENEYVVSSLGRVRKIAQDSPVLREGDASDGGSVTLRKEGKKHKRALPKLVYESHKGCTVGGGHKVVHRDGDSTNNSIDNLYMVRRDHSTVRGERCCLSVLGEEDIHEIRERSDSGESTTELSLDFGVSPATISSIRNRKSWTHVPEARASTRPQDYFVHGVMDSIRAAEHPDGTHRH